MTVLMVIGTILMCFAVDWLVRIRKAPVTELLKSGHAREHTTRVRLPQGLFFAPSHTWMSLLPSGKVWLGVDDFVGRLLDSPRVKLLVKAGDSVRRGDPILSLAENGHSLTVRSPLDGDVVACNGDLVHSPELLREKTFSEGWALALQPAHASELKRMLLGDETRTWIQDEFARLRDVFAGAGGALSPAMLQDGGPPMAGAMKEMDEAVWKRFESEFLSVE